ncbi:hypothetical protein Drorol1_Dr00024990 [Drosera rotundifolia]
MVTGSSTSTTPTTITNTSNLNSPTQSNLVAFNSTQLPIKLTPTNFPSWKAQFDALLFRYDLLGFVDGKTPCPPKTINDGETSVPNSAWTFWQRQDKLLFHALMSSLSEKVVPIISSATSSADAWDRLTKSYANASSSRIMGLTGQLTGVQRGTQSMTDYLSHVCSLAEELALIGSSVPAPHLILHTLNNVGPEYRDIAAAIRARDSTISFEELQDKLVEYESFLKRDQQRSVGTVTAYPARFNPCNVTYF